MSLKPPPSPAGRDRPTVSIQQNKLVFKDGNVHNDLRHEDDDFGMGKEAVVLVREHEWLKTFNTHRTLVKLQKVLQECCRRLHLSNKLDPSVDIGVQAASSEQLHLKQRNGMDAFKVTVVLVGENIIQSEVNFKYPKAPGGFLKTSAQPEVQWKLQQLQDAGNFCCMALNAVTKGLELVRGQHLENEDVLTLEAGNQLSSIVSMVGDLVIQARSALCLPRKRTLLELCSFPPTRCFKPPLPSDLVFSYYVASTRIVCAAYHITAKQSDGRDGLTATLADCELPLLVNFLSLLNQAVEVIRELRQNLSLFDSHICAASNLDSQSVHL